MQQIYFLFMVVALLPACSFFQQPIKGSGKIANEERTVSDFTKINLSGMGELFVKQGETFSLRVEADENILEYLQSEVKDGTLQLTEKSKGRFSLLNPTQPIRFYVEAPLIEELSLSGSGNITTEGVLKASKLHVEITGAGNVAFEAQTEEFIARILGAGNITAKGTSTRQQVDIIGSGNYLAPELANEVTYISISGSGNVTVKGGKALHVRITGSGHVYYSNDPKINQSITGSGSLEQL